MGGRLGEIIIKVNAFIVDCDDKDREVNVDSDVIKIYRVGGDVGSKFDFRKNSSC